MDRGGAVRGRALTAEKDPLFLAAWTERLRPVRKSLLMPLGTIYGNPAFSDAQRMAATGVLAELGEEDRERLASLILDADDRRHAVLFRLLSKDATQTSLSMRRALETRQAGGTPDDRDRQARRQLNAACTLARLGQWDPVWPLLKSSDDPWLRTLLIHRVHSYGIVAASLCQGLKARDPAIRQAILLALGEYPAGSLAAHEQSALAETCRRLFLADPDSGVHAGAEWLLRKWNRQAELRDLQWKLAGGRQPGWYINGQGQTMVVLRVPVAFVVGSPPSKPVRSDRSFAISAHEITIEQFHKFRPQFKYAANVAVHPDCPINNVSWYDAAAYCHWLTEQEKIADAQQCYPEKPGPGMVLPADCHSRRDIACRPRPNGSTPAVPALPRAGSTATAKRCWPSTPGTRPTARIASGRSARGNRIHGGCSTRTATCWNGVIIRGRLPRSLSAIRWCATTSQRPLRGGGYRYTARVTRSESPFALAPMRTRASSVFVSPGPCGSSLLCVKRFR